MTFWLGNYEQLDGVWLSVSNLQALFHIVLLSTYRHSAEGKCNCYVNLGNCMFNGDRYERSKVNRYQVNPFRGKNLLLTCLLTCKFPLLGSMVDCLISMFTHWSTSKERTLRNFHFINQLNSGTLNISYQSSGSHIYTSYDKPCRWFEVAKLKRTSSAIHILESS